MQVNSSKLTPHNEFTINKLVQILGQVSVFSFPCQQLLPHWRVMTWKIHLDHDRQPQYYYEQTDCKIRRYSSLVFRS